MNVCVAQGDKKKRFTLWISSESLYSKPTHCLNTCQCKEDGGVDLVEKAVIDWGYKRKGIKSTTFNSPHIDGLLGLHQLVLKSMLFLKALNGKSFKLYYVRIYEPFQNINSALFKVSVKDSCYSLQHIDSYEGLRTSITCDVWLCERDLFFMTETLYL